MRQRKKPEKPFLARAKYELDHADELLSERQKELERIRAEKNAKLLTMNTMDKIFVSEGQNTEHGFFGLWSDIYMEDTPCSEYIRKETLLEWAKNELESARQTDWDEFGRGEVITLESIIKKLNSL